MILYFIKHCNLKHDLEYWIATLQLISMSFSATFNSVSVIPWCMDLNRHLYYLNLDFDSLIMILKFGSDLRKENALHVRIKTRLSVII